MSKHPPKWSTRYTEKMDFEDILEAVDAGAYSVDLATGEVTSVRKGEPLYTWSSGRSPNLWVRLYRNGRQIAIPRAHLVWITGTRTPIPEGWEVHHEDANPTNDAFNNLYCLHPVDHGKAHGRKFEPEEIPF